jgi:MFS family permease
MCVNLFDRVNLPVAAPVLGPELHLSTWALGLLLSSFFWSYSVGQIGSGWLVDHVEVRSAYALAFCLWSVATLCMALSTSFAGLMSLLLLLGICESVAYPATSHIIAAAFPEERRGLANSLVDVGARLGPAAGTLCGGLLIAKVGWRGLFVICGVGGLLWVIPWLAIAPRIPPPSNGAGNHAVGWKLLLSQRAMWGTTGGLCGANYAWYFLLSWLPSYLVRERHFSLRSMATLGSVPFILMAISSLSGGIASDYLIRQGKAPIAVRKGFLISGLVVTALLLPTVLLPGIAWSLAGLYLSSFAFGAYASNLYSLTQTLAGPQAAGRWTGIQNACGNVAGIASTVITGWLVQRTGSFAMPFVGASGACLFGALSFWFLVPEKRPEIIWS